MMENLIQLERTAANTEPPFTKKSTAANIELPEAKWFLRLKHHPWVMPYNRLAILMIVINSLIAFNFSLGLAQVSNLILANFAVAILIRMQDTVNLLFRLATGVPQSWPISVRWALGKIYHFGGIHVGCYFSGSIWYAYYLLQLIQGPLAETSLVALAVVHFTILISVMIMAIPAVRAQHHNEFEIIARFGNWASLLLFWVQTILTVKMHLPEGGNFGLQLLATPAIWTLSVLTFAVVLPWLRMRKVPVEITTPSNHVALTKFNYGVKPFAGSSTDLSLNPLLEWHSFANVPSPWEDGYRLTISRAGDWTGRWIDEKPKHVWVKGIPAAGVGNIELLFKRVVWVATGSGIGPCLPHLFANQVPSSLVWSTRNPNKTYGEELVRDIRHVQPQAIIWDTDQNGKPDLVKLAYEACKKYDAEAVICISNKKVTWNVVYELESRGIPAFGAIWDS